MSQGDFEQIQSFALGVPAQRHGGAGAQPGIITADAPRFVGEQLVLADSDRLLVSSLIIFCEDNDL